MGQLDNKENLDEIEVVDEVSDSLESTEADSVSTSDENQLNTIETLKNKILDFLINLNKRIETFLKSPFGKFTIVTFIFLLFAGPILLTVLGFDNIVIRSSVEGVVVDTDGNSIEDVEIKLQGTTVTTDSKGYYIFDDLDYGVWQVKIEAEGYEIYTEQLTINRFSNKKDFELTPLDIGEFFGSFTNEKINLNQFSLSINDLELEISPENTFTSGRLVIGSYELILKSPYYKDFSKEIIIKSGENDSVPIELVPAGDILGITYDYLGRKKLEDVDIKVKGTDKSVEFDEENNFIIRDITVNSNVEISFEKTGYKKKIEKETVENGENTLDKVLLVPEGKILSESNQRIVVSDFDGKKEILVSENTPGCELLVQTNSFIGTKCSTALYKSNLETGAIDYLAFSYASSGLTNNFDIVQIDNTGTRTLTLNDITIFQSATEDIVSFISDNSGKNLYISTTSGIYWDNIDDTNSPTKIADGIYSLEGLSPSSDILIALNRANSDGTLSNIWTISTNGEKVRKTVLPKVFSNITWFDDERILYLVNENGKKNLYKFNIENGKETRLIENVSSYIFNKTLNLITTSDGSQRYIVNINGSKYLVGE